MGINQKKKADLDDRLNSINNLHNDITDMDEYLVTSDELPGFGEVELYNYDQDLNVAKKTGKELISNLVDLYLGDNDAIRNHPYILSKMDDDSEYYSEMKMVQKMGQKLFLQAMRQIDSGDISANMYRVSTELIKELRENIKDGRKAKAEIESTYKEMRKDLGMNATIQNDSVDLAKDEEEGGNIIDNAKLNDMIRGNIDNFLKNRDNNKNDK